MHNLAPVVGEVNGDRSNFNIGMIGASPPQYGQCRFKVDFKNRMAEPPDEAKGMMARSHFYMADRYGLAFSQKQERLLIIWDQKFPPTSWEIERDRRIGLIVGHGNDFVSRRKVWTIGYRPSRDGLQVSVMLPSTATTARPPNKHEATGDSPLVIGNRDSHIYHVQFVCPGYASVSQKNRVPLPNEAAAKAAGFRRAKNCK